VQVRKSLVSKVNDFQVEQLSNSPKGLVAPAGGMVRRHIQDVVALPSDEAVFARDGLNQLSSSFQTLKGRFEKTLGVGNML